MVGPVERLQFVLFGSSIVEYSFRDEGWGAILADLYARKADILLRGYGGWNSRRAVQVLDRVFPKSLSANTRIIFLTAPPMNEQQFRESRIISELGDLGRTNVSCRVYSEACLKLCQEMDVKAIDLWTAMQQMNDWSTTCFTDGVHLSSEGSKIVVKEILKVLREAEWEPSLHWRSLPTEFAEDSSFYPVAPDGKTTINVSNLSNALCLWD